MPDLAADAQEIVARLTSGRSDGMSPQDAETLLAVPNRTLMMEKLLALYFNQTRDFARALDQAQAVFAAEPNAENANNVALMFRSAERCGAGIAFAEENRDTFDPIAWHDTMCMLHYSNGDPAEAARYGARSLELKDAAAPPAEPIQPITRPFNREARERNVIAFSLFGEDPRYLEGAEHNAIVTRYLYPGWSCRVYVDDSVPREARRRLGYQGAQVLKVADGWAGPRMGLFWRFLVEDDADVDLFLIRDADSVMNIKERAAVEDWLASGRAFHVMRDLPTHSELILAGMWGAHRGNIGRMAERIQAHVAAAPLRLNHRIIDQEFARTELWPILRQDLCSHDSTYDFCGAERFRGEFALPRAVHIGQNDWVHRKPRARSADPVKSRHAGAARG